MNQFAPEKADNGLSAMLNGNYLRADSIWRSMSERHPESPFPIYYKILTLQGKMVDLEIYEQMNEFDNLRDSLMQKCKKQFKINRPALYFYFKGAVAFYKANLLTRLNHNWEAFSESRKGAEWLEQAIQIDSTLAEPVILLSAYKYWKSRKAGFLRKLFLIRDERKKGIHELKSVSIGNTAVQAIRNDQLAWIYIDTGHPSEALKLIQWNLVQYSNSRFFKWTLFSIWLALRDEKKASDLMFELHHSYAKTWNRYPVNYLKTLQKLLKIIPPHYRNEELKQILDQFREHRAVLIKSKRLKKYLESIDSELMTNWNIRN